jgi:hypothetical protein
MTTGVVDVETANEGTDAKSRLAAGRTAGAGADADRTDTGPTTNA